MNKNNLIFLILCVFVSSVSNSYQKVIGFEKAVEQCKKLDRRKFRNRFFWNKFVDRYNWCIKNKATYQTELRIPKIIHQIWLGSPFPEKYIAFRDSWLKNHPDWEYKLWTEEEIEELNLVNKKYYDEATNYGEKSDIARYEILYRYGGLYIDTDFQCLQSFEELHHLCDFYVGLYDGMNAMIGNAIIGAAPNHPLLKRTINSIDRNPNAKNNARQIMQRTGPPHLKRNVESYIKQNPNDLVVVLPPGYLFPWPHWARRNKSWEAIKQWLKPYSLAIHHWHVSWMKNNNKK